MVFFSPNILPTECILPTDKHPHKHLNNVTVRAIKEKKYNFMRERNTGYTSGQKIFPRENRI